MTKLVSLAASILWLCIILLPNAALAQTVDRCSDVLVDGTRSYENLESSKYLRRISFNRLSTRSYKEVTRDREAGLDVPGYFEGDYDEFYHAILQYSMDRLNFKTLTSSEETSYLLSFGDSEIIQAWKECMGNKFGMISTPIVQSPTSISVEIKYSRGGIAGVPRDAELKENARIAGAKLVGAESIKEHPCLNKGQKIDENGCSVSLLAPNPQSEIIFSINTSAGPISTFVPRRSSWAWQTKTISDSVKVVRSDVVNRDIPNQRKVRVPNQMLDERWVVVPNSYSVDRVIRNGDGRCLADTPKFTHGQKNSNGEIIPDTMTFFDVDIRVDRNPGDRTLDCEYIIKFQIGRLEDKLQP